MPSNATAKTKSAPSLLSTSVLAGLFLVCAWYCVQNPLRTLNAGSNYYTLEVAASSEQRQLGLSGRSDLAPNHGMLFVYYTDDMHCFWMKDTRIALDMIWLNAEKRVVHVAPNVTPDTYPQSFCPSGPSRMVIELKAGEADHSGIKPGQILNF